MSEATFTHQDVRLHYVDHGGTGLLILLLPGMGDTAHVFQDFADALGPGYRVVAFTRRGYGQSDKPVRGYDADTLAADIIALIDHLGAERATLIGHSFAGVEMTRIAERYPDRVDRLVYLDAAYDKERLPQLLEADPAGEPSPRPQDRASCAALMEWAKRVYGFWSPGMEHNFRITYCADDGSVRMLTPASVAKQLFETMVGTRPNWSAVKAPALALYAIETKESVSSELDESTRTAAQRYVEGSYAPWQLAQARRFDSEAPCSRVVLMPGAHHYLFIERQAEVAAHVRAFLTDRSPCS